MIKLFKRLFNKHYIDPIEVEKIMLAKETETTIAGKVAVAEELLEMVLIKTPQQYFDFLNNKIFGEEKIITNNDAEFLESAANGQIKTKKSQARRVSSTTSKTLKKRNKKKRSRNKAAKKRV